MVFDEKFFRRCFEQMKKVMGEVPRGNQESKINQIHRDVGEYIDQVTQAEALSMEHYKGNRYIG